jgi:hypothetical protein
MRLIIDIHESWFTDPRVMAVHLATARRLEHPIEELNYATERARKPAVAPTPLKPDPPAKNNGVAMITGPELLVWIAKQPAPRETQKKAQSIGKKLGYGWRIASWKPEQALKVHQALAAGNWGGNGK